MAYQPTTNFGWAMPRGGDQAQISVINQQFTAKADEIVYQTRRMIAPGYIDDGTKTYQPGEIVEYENVDYICTGTTSGVWDSSKWDSTDMATQIQEAKESGGTNVEANPVEAATADLHKLKVDTTVYGIPDPTVTKTATGNPIEFSDGADAPLVKCVTEIQGSQDLHGYDKPWVGGAGKNKLALTVADFKAQNTSGTWSGNVYTYLGCKYTLNVDSGGNVESVGVEYLSQATDVALSFSLKAGTYTLSSGFDENNGINDSYLVKDGVVIARGNNASPGTQFTLSEDSTVVWHLRVTNKNYTVYPMLRLSTVSDPTFAPYSNICPITAYTEGEIEVRGKNLLDIETAQSYGSKGSSTITNIDNGISVVTTGNYAGVYCEIDGVANGECTLSFDYTFINSGTASFAVLASDNSTVLYNSGDFTTSGTKTATFTKSTGTKIYLRIYTTRAGNYGNATITNATLHDSDYTSTTHTTTFPSAIYRGSEDVVNGEVSAEKIVYTISDDTGVQGLTALTNVTRVIIDINATQLKSSGTHISNYLEYIANYTLDEPHFYFDSNNRVVAFFPGVMTGDQWRTYVANNPLQIAYEVNPTTSSVTPTNLPIKSLSGYNHIESSTGDMEVEYITQNYQPLVDLIDEAADTKRAYSTTEHVVGKWIDGSDVYERTIDLGSFSVGSWSDHTIESSTSINLLIDYDGYMVESNIMYALPDPSVRIKVDESHNLIFTGTSSWNVTSGHLTIRYTKTSSNNRSLSKGPSVEVTEKTEEPVEEPTEKEENER